MNVFTFSGFLGSDCRKGTGQTAVVNFSVGVKSGYGEKEQTVWVDVALWGKQAEGKLSDYLNKGQQVEVSGELGTREHNGKTYVTCRANNVGLIGSKKEGGSSPAPQQQSRPAPSQQAAPPDADPFIDDIPFAPAHYLMGA